MRYVFSTAGVCTLDFGEAWARRWKTLERRFGKFSMETATDPWDLSSRLADYFAGDGRAFDGVATDPGGTAFQQKVWVALRKLQFGQRISYGELARQIGSPKAVRAVGAANGANPVALIVPCHRVIGANGRLVGYASGVDRKRWLLAHEAGSALPVRQTEVA
jgi:methylated-DNA-[protein]-cysteine S-methyltransferase